MIKILFWVMVMTPSKGGVVIDVPQVSYTSSEKCVEDATYLSKNTLNVWGYPGTLTYVCVPKFKIVEGTE